MMGYCRAHDFDLAQRRLPEVHRRCAPCSPEAPVADLTLTPAQLAELAREVENDAGAWDLPGLRLALLAAARREARLREAVKAALQDPRVAFVDPNTVRGFRAALAYDGKEEEP